MDSWTALRVCGRIVHLRKLSRKLLFLDIRITEVLKANEWRLATNEAVPRKEELVDHESEGLRVLRTDNDLEDTPEGSLIFRRDMNPCSSAGLPCTGTRVSHADLPRSNVHSVEESDYVTVGEFAELDNCRGRKLEVVVKYPEFEDVRQVAAAVGMGDVILVRGEKVEAVARNGLQLALLHAQEVEVVRKGEGRNREVERPKVERPKVVHDANDGAEIAANLCQQSFEENDARSSNRCSSPANLHLLSADCCKFWINTGSCSKGASCPFSHPTGVMLAAARASWIEARLERRVVTLKSPLDPIGGHEKEGRHSRGRIFAEWLVEEFGLGRLNQGNGVLDIAGGRGGLSFALSAMNGVKATVVDPRPQKPSKTELKFLKKNPSCLQPAAIKGLFSSEEPIWAEMVSNASCVVGMHPDEATDDIVLSACRASKPFAVVPCCVFPFTFSKRKLRRQDGTTASVETYEDLVEYLVQLAASFGGDAERQWLKFVGRNQVVFCKAYNN